MAALLKGLYIAVHARYSQLESDSTKKKVARDNSTVRTFENCGELYFLSRRDEAGLADIFYLKLDDTLTKMADYSFVAITDDYIFAGPGADEEKKRLAQKRLAPTNMIYRKMWFDQLQGKLSSFVEIVVWNTGNSGFLKFAIKLPDEEKVDDVKLFSSRQRVLAAIPRFSTAKELRAAKELLDTLLPESSHYVEAAFEIGADAEMPGSDQPKEPAAPAETNVRRGVRSTAGAIPERFRET